MISEKCQDNLLLKNPNKFCGEHLNNRRIPLNILIKYNIREASSQQIVNHINKREQSLPHVEGNQPSMRNCQSQNSLRNQYKYNSLKEVDTNKKAIEQHLQNLQRFRNKESTTQTQFPKKIFFNGVQEVVLSDSVPDQDIDLFQRLKSLPYPPKKKYFIPMTQNQQIGWFENIKENPKSKNFQFLRSSCEETQFGKDYFAMYKASLYSNKFK